ncbi:MAG: class I SAM-dependent methyltransferase, partial [Gemmatimonadetes bacterium]|nr:class I SAM-dependent methyltransferase [Gemmatimonadota bacterium]
MDGSNDESVGVDTSRAVVFGEDAERYDRARPSYPAALVDSLVGLAGQRILDVGCGTGKAGRLLARQGLDVLGVDPDERMAEVARRRGLVVEVARFEEWDPRGRSFDLVVSGQAWHWIDPRVGLAKAAEVLAPGGSLALFWNRPGYDPVIRTKLDEVYQRVAPGMAKSSAELGTVGDDRTSEDVAAIEDCG